MQILRLFGRRISRTSLLIGLGAAVAVLIIGYVVVRSIAAGYLFAAEAEQGATSGSAQVLNDPTASGGKAIVFKVADIPPPTTPPPSGAQSCPPFPAFPDENCTGVPTGTKLTAVSGSLSTTSAGQVIDAREIKGDLIISHDNITVTNSRIYGRVAYNGHRGLTLRDVDLGPDSCAASTSDYQLLSGDDYTLTRVHVHNSPADLIRMSGGGGKILIQDSLINRGCFYAGDHLDALQYYDPKSVANVTINHSNIDVRPVNSNDKGNAAILITDNPGSGSRFTLYQNLFAGGNFSITANDILAGSNSIVDINSNRFVRGSYAYGPCSLDNTVVFNGTAGIKLTNNAYTDGTPINGC